MDMNGRGLSLLVRGEGVAPPTPASVVAGMGHTGVCKANCVCACQGLSYMDVWLRVGRMCSAWRGVVALFR